MPRTRLPDKLLPAGAGGPTASASVSEWADLGFGGGSDVHFVLPRESGSAAVASRPSADALAAPVVTIERQARAVVDLRATAGGVAAPVVTLERNARAAVDLDVRVGGAAGPVVTLERQPGGTSSARIVELAAPTKPKGQTVLLERSTRGVAGAQPPPSALDPRVLYATVGGCWLWVCKNKGSDGYPAMAYDYANYSAAKLACGFMGGLDPKNPQWWPCVNGRCGPERWHAGCTMKVKPASIELASAGPDLPTATPAGRTRPPRSDCKECYQGCDLEALKCIARCAPKGQSVDEILYNLQKCLADCTNAQDACKKTKCADCFGPPP